METKKLAQMALAAFVVAASVPATSQAVEASQEVKGVLLAAHACGSHCGGQAAERKSDISYNTTTDSSASSTNNPYNTNANTYRAGSNYNSTNAQGAQSGNYSPSSSTQTYNPGNNSPAANASMTGSSFGNRGTASDSSYLNNNNNGAYRSWDNTSNDTYRNSSNPNNSFMNTGTSGSMNR